MNENHRKQLRLDGFLLLLSDGLRSEFPVPLQGTTDSVTLTPGSETPLAFRTPGLKSIAPSVQTACLIRTGRFPSGVRGLEAVVEALRQPIRCLARHRLATVNHSWTVARFPSRVQDLEAVIEDLRRPFRCLARHRLARAMHPRTAITLSPMSELHFGRTFESRTAQRLRISQPCGLRRRCYGF